MLLSPQIAVGGHHESLVEIDVASGLAGLEVQKAAGAVNQGDDVERPAVLVDLRNKCLLERDRADFVLLAPVAELPEGHPRLVDVDRRLQRFIGYALAFSPSGAVRRSAKLCAL